MAKDFNLADYHLLTVIVIKRNIFGRSTVCVHRNMSEDEYFALTDRMMDLKQSFRARALRSNLNSLFECITFDADKCSAVCI